MPGEIPANKPQYPGVQTTNPETGQHEPASPTHGKTASRSVSSLPPDQVSPQISVSSEESVPSDDSIISRGMEILARADRKLKYQDRHQLGTELVELAKSDCQLPLTMEEKTTLAKEAGAAFGLYKLSGDGKIKRMGKDVKPDAEMLSRAVTSVTVDPLQPQLMKRLAKEQPALFIKLLTCCKSDGINLSPLKSYNSSLPLNSDERETLAKAAGEAFGIFKLTSKGQLKFLDIKGNALEKAVTGATIDPFQPKLLQHLAVKHPKLYVKLLTCCETSHLDASQMEALYNSTELYFSKGEGKDAIAASKASPFSHNLFPSLSKEGIKRAHWNSVKELDALHKRDGSTSISAGPVEVTSGTRVLNFDFDSQPLRALAVLQRGRCIYASVLAARTMNDALLDGASDPELRRLSQKQNEETASLKKDSVNTLYGVAQELLKVADPTMEGGQKYQHTVYQYETIDDKGEPVVLTIYNNDLEQTRGGWVISSLSPEQWKALTGLQNYQWIIED